MPASSIRDLVIHGDDLVVGTHGRSFWILDDITPLRQLNSSVAASDSFMFEPQLTYRVKRSINPDTPLPPDEPTGKNPPDGAIIDYFLKADAGGPVTLEISDSANKLIKRFSSDDVPEPVNDKELNVPTYWVRPQQILSAKAGMQRFVWDLHYPAPKVPHYDYPISAVYMDTPPAPQGPVVMPGKYIVRLKVGGRIYESTLEIKMDPRVKTSEAGLQKQFDLSIQAYNGINRTRDVLDHIQKYRTQIKDLQARTGQGQISSDLGALDQKLMQLAGNAGERRANSASGGADTDFGKVNAAFGTMLELLQDADVMPTRQAIAESAALETKLSELMTRWTEFRNKELPALNERLKQAQLSLLSVE